MIAFLRRFILHVSVPLTKWIGTLHAPFSRKKLSAKDYREIKLLAKPGYVLLSRARGEFSNLFIPGHWSHAAILADNEKVVEATYHGVVETDLIDFVLKKDYVALMEPTFASESIRETSGVFALSYIGKPYDFMFDSGVDAFYCSELVYQCYQDAYFPLNSPFTKRENMGVLTVVPEDFWLAKKKFKTVWSNY
jgi:cell wall-associated NlpC family hydrolase